MSIKVDGKLKNLCSRRNCLECTPFGQRTKAITQVPKWCEKGILTQAVQESLNIGDTIIKAMHLSGTREFARPNNLWYNQFRKYQELYEIDISHFRKLGATKFLTHEEIFCLNSRVDQSTMRKAYHLLFPDQRCSRCGLNEWMGEILPVDVDHINGNHIDNRLENLRYLCPNCHRQTGTYAKVKKSKSLLVPVS
jgi:hypothetical protein